MSTGIVGARELIAPDGEFVRDLINLGGDAVKRCFQCGTCSVVCPLSPSDRPFPRKEMIWVQWGLKDRLLKDPDIWLCHQCSDCSNYCPRGSRAGDVMAALRSYTIMRMAVPGSFASAFSRPGMLPLLLGVAMLSLFAFLAIIGRLAFPAGEVSYERFIPSIALDVAGILVVAVALGVAAVGLVRFWRNLGSFEADAAPADRTGGGLWSATLATVVDILKHRNFGQCGTDRVRYYEHLAILYGFLLLFAATTGRAIYYWLLGRHDTPPLTDPVKLAGNLGAVLVLGGLTLVIYNRATRESRIGKSTYFDWFFIWVLYLTTLTGVVTEVARLAQMGTFAYWAYLGHLLLVFMLLAYLPYSKFAHLFYRTVAMVRARQLGRETAPARQP